MGRVAKKPSGTGRKKAAKKRTVSKQPGNPVRTLLIANRGEIAVRVAHTCRALGIKTVAVYSDADADAPHVRAADAAVRIGPAPAAESYLVTGALLDAARATGADAVHPGYGFLAENAAFAGAVREAGLTFVGPPAEVIEAMGDKAAAKDRMAKAGVPVVPGYTGADQSDATLAAEAKRIGWPLLIKPAAGGGGKGMRVVRRAQALAEAVAGARREARAAFGDDRLILERFLDPVRHVEVQVFGDTQGTVVHLFERECSIQRRHQKIIEEAPSPAVTPALRETVTAAAVAAARAVGYVNAGTVEGLLDAEGHFYFMEMNTRLQVEHPVTELITGTDLVHWQLTVAGGGPLPLAQEAIRRHGHALEARWYAEDPDQGFLPSVGTLSLLEVPRGPGLRFDNGVETGSRISEFYDPMLAKLAAWGPDRATATRRLTAALKDSAALGVATNLPLLIAALEHPAFARGETFTNFLDRHLPQGAPAPESLPPAALLALAAAANRGGGGPHRVSPGAKRSSPWDTLGSWQLLPDSKGPRP